jgi:hypothetical protein
VPTSPELPELFRVIQRWPVPGAVPIADTIWQQLADVGLAQRTSPGQSLALTVGSRGIANIAEITAAVVSYCRHIGLNPFVVPAMGSHGAASAEGQRQVLANLGVTPERIGCEIRSSMETVVVAEAPQGFPVHFDAHAYGADHVLVMNRVKPHTRFAGQVESGLMKMMLIGLGKYHGAQIYHRVIQNFSFDEIVRSVARLVVERCRIVAGLAILEDADEQTAGLVAVPPESIELQEAELLSRVRQWLPKLPFPAAEILVLDEIGKDISGAGMDTNVVGRKYNDHAARHDEYPKLHHIYVRGLSKKSGGNATGIGIAELCHRRVIDAMDPISTRVNCITGGHLTAAMLPLAFETDREALETAAQVSGWYTPQQLPMMWIPNTLKLGEVLCSQVFWDEAEHRDDLTILHPPRPIEFDEAGNLVEQFR